MTSTQTNPAEAPPRVDLRPHAVAFLANNLRTNGYEHHARTMEALAALHAGAETRNAVLDVAIMECRRFAEDAEAGKCMESLAYEAQAPRIAHDIAVRLGNLKAAPAERMILGADEHPAKGAGGVALPPLPEPVDELAQADGYNVIGSQPVFTADQMRAYALADRQQRGGNMDEREAFEAWWCSQDEGSIQFDLQQYPEDLKATLTNLWITAWQACQAAHKPDGGATRTLHHYGDVLQPFVQNMADELLANAGKGDRPGWLSCSADDLMLEVYYHAAKLQKAVKDGNRDGIREYSADVANLAMMVLDVCGGIYAAISAQQRQDGGER